MSEGQGPPPKSIRLLREGVIIIWDDDHSSLYPHQFLRGNCPCAMCVNEVTGKRTVGINDVSEYVRALDWMPIGKYALQFLWSDAHDTGYYPFKPLRNLCPCPNCKAGRPEI